MQFQMYVTGLYTCDFLETIFKEYDSEEAFNNDGVFGKTESGKPKGMIVCFHDGEKPVYEYPPWNCSENEFNIWYDDIMNKNEHLSWIMNTYWYLDEYSCVTVPFNEDWFNQAKPHLKIFGKLLKKRVEGYDHRKPKKRARKPPIESPLCEPSNLSSQLDDDFDLEPPKLVLKLKHSR